MLKEKLRLNYLNLRKTLSPSDVISKSLDISNQLLQLPIWSFDYFHLFLSISEKKEVDTSFVLSILQGKDKNVVLPKMVKNQQLINYLLTDNTIIKKNKYGVPEPLDGIEVPANKIQVVFMPLLAFDKRGNRVGYGKGYYDNFLTMCGSNVVKIGLSFYEAEAEISDVSEMDVPMDYCITPNKIYSF
ncbi:5-formyltetrahydrofolate cyclo-ligase [Spongiimicrobium sp. 3-5]|uniref:5-formyltetrahydrofolate cyclo-ligase n=1 Tax=Spongiimicrobium sp. 3-5 TaxID=3332596 RepID=UPI0039803A45